MVRNLSFLYTVGWNSSEKKRVGFYLRQSACRNLRESRNTSDSRFARSPSRRRKREEGGGDLSNTQILFLERSLQRPLPLLPFLPSRFPHIISSPLPRLAPRTQKSHKIKIPRGAALRCPLPPPPLSCEEQERFLFQTSLRRERVVRRGRAHKIFSIVKPPLSPLPSPSLTF